MITASPPFNGGAVTGTISGDPRIAPLFVSAAPTLNFTIDEDGMTTPVSAGLGSHDVILNISAQVAAFAALATPLTITSALMTVLDPDEGIQQYNVASTDAANFYTSTVTTASCTTETHTFVKFRHLFEKRGEHRVAIEFTLSSGEYITATEAIRVYAGDGLYEDVV